MTLPAVVTAVGGNTEIVTDSRTGYVVPPSDAVGLGQAMERLMKLSPRTRGGFGAAARKHCVETFSFDIVVGKWDRALFRLSVENIGSVRQDAGHRD